MLWSENEQKQLCLLTHLVCYLLMRSLTFLFIFLFGVSSHLAADETLCDQENNPAVQSLVLNLEKAVNIALSAQRRIGNAKEAILLSEINLELAESEFDLRFIPKGDTGYIGGGRAGEGFTFGTGVEASKKFSNGTRFSIYPSTMKAAKHFKSNVKTTLTQPLLRGFGKEYTLAPVFAAQYANRGAMRAYYLTQVRLILQTVTALYEIIRQQSLADLEKESMARVKKFCLSTRIKEKIGLCDALDVYRAENELKQAEDSLNQAEERLQEAKDHLRDTLALPLDQPIQVDVPIVYDPVTISLDEAVKIALESRIEIDQAKDALQESRRLQRIAKDNLWPEVNLVIDYTSFSRDETFTSSWTNKRESKWGIGFTTSTDIAKPRETAAFEQSELAVSDAQRNMEQVQDNVILDVKRTLRSLQRAHDKIVLQEEQILNAKKGFHLARIKFEHAKANNFDLVQAEKTLRLAQTAFISAIIEHKVGEFKLLASLGMLADKPGFCR